MSTKTESVLNQRLGGEEKEIRRVLLDPRRPVDAKITGYTVRVGTRQYTIDVCHRNAFRDPIYFIFKRREVYQLVFMSPVEYLKQLPNVNFTEDCSHWEDVVRRSPKMLRAKVLFHIDLFEKNCPLTVGFYQGEGGLNQEGRHRACAAWDRDIPSIPVFRVLHDLTDQELRLQFPNPKSVVEQLLKSYVSLDDLAQRDMVNFFESAEESSPQKRQAKKQPGVDRPNFPSQPPKPHSNPPTCERKPKKT